MVRGGGWRSGRPGMGDRDGEETGEGWITSLNGHAPNNPHPFPEGLRPIPAP